VNYFFFVLPLFFGLLPLLLTLAVSYKLSLLGGFYRFAHGIIPPLALVLLSSFTRSPLSFPPIFDGFNP